MGEDSDRPADEDPAPSEADETTHNSLDDEPSDSDGSGAADDGSTENADSGSNDNDDDRDETADESVDDAAADPIDVDTDDPDEEVEDDEVEDDEAEDDEAEDDEVEDEDSDALTEDEYQEQLEEAAATNPPLDRDEVVDEDPIETSNGGTSSAENPRPTISDDGMFEGPESDEEMPLAVHIEEMMRRLGVVFLVGGIATLVAFPIADQLINYFWASHIPSPWENRPRLYGPLEYILTKLKVAGLAGVLFGLPLFVYQTYLFMRPGLYQNERRYYLAAVPTSLVLGIVGGLFAHFLVLPAIFSYFTTYTEGAAVIAFGLAETFNLIVIMIAFMAVVFQIPLFIMLAIMMNLTTREWLEQKRLLFWGSFFGIAFIFSPDPTGMAPIIVTLTMIVLFEGTLALLRWTGN